MDDPKAAGPECRAPGLATVGVGAVCRFSWFEFLCLIGKWSVVHVDFTWKNDCFV